MFKKLIRFFWFSGWFLLSVYVAAIPHDHWYATAFFWLCSVVQATKMIDSFDEMTTEP